MKLWATGLLVAASVGAASQMASAAALSVDLDYQNTNFTSSSAGFLGLKGDLTVTFNLPGPNNTVSTSTVGSFGWKVNNDSDTTDVRLLGASLQTFCIQAYQNFSTSSNSIVFNEVTPTSTSVLPVGGADQGYLDLKAAQQIQSLINNHWTEVFKDTTGVKAAAFQLAVWEVVYDGGGDSLGGGDNFKPGNTSSTYFGSSSGIVTATSKNSLGSSAISYATSWLNAITVVSLDAGTMALTNAYKQDQITFVPGTGAPPPSTPMPAALPMGLSAIGGLALYRKFRRKS